MTQLPSVDNPSVFALVLCEAQGPQCVLHQQKIGTNKDNWFFWTVIQDTRYEFAAFGGNKLVDGTHWYECITCEVRGTYLELTSSRGTAREYGIFQPVPLETGATTVTPEPSVGLLVASGLAIIGRKLRKRGNRCQLIQQ